MAGLTTSLLIGAGISAAAGVGSAAIASRAAGKAADTQQEAADKALAFQQRMYEQERLDTAPIRNVGNQAAQTLSGLMGLPSGPVAGQVAPTPTIGPPAGYIPNEHGVGFGILKPGVTPQQALQMNPTPAPAGGSSLASLGAPSMPPGGQQTQSGYVLLEAPTGERQMVAPNEVPHYMQMGARRV